MARVIRSSYNHARKDVYTCKRNERFANHFLVSPKMIYENELRFVYFDGKTEVSKKVPMTVVIRNAKPRKFFGVDPETGRPEWKGEAYEIPSHVIETYRG